MLDRLVVLPIVVQRLVEADELLPLLLLLRPLVDLLDPRLFARGGRALLVIRRLLVGVRNSLLLALLHIWLNREPDEIRVVLQTAQQPPRLQSLGLVLL